MPNVGRPSRDCDTCRRRRTKCDKVRPACAPCLRKGLACPGYRDEVDVLFRSETVSSFESNRSRDGRRTTVASNIFINNNHDNNCTPKRTSTKRLDEKKNATTLITSYIPFRILGSRRDQQLYHYYREMTCRALSEYHATKFWVSTVPRWAVHEPVVLRCLVANTFIYQRFKLMPLEGDKKTTTALAKRGVVDGDARLIASWQEYCNALQLLRQYIAGIASSSSSSSVSREVVLTCIAVLYGTAHAMGKPQDAQTHMRAGSDILSSWKKERKKNNPNLQTDDFEAVLEVFSAIYLQGLFLDDNVLSSPYMVDTTTTAALCGPPIPNQFGNVIEAQNVSEDTLRRYFRCVIDSYYDNDNDDRPLLAVERQLGLWLSSFREIESTAFDMSSKTTLSARYHTALLSAQQWSISALIKSGLFLREKQKFKPVLSALHLSRAARIYSLLKSNFIISTDAEEENAEIGTYTQLQEFYFRPGVVPYMYLEMAQGRDLALQSKALSNLWSQVTDLGLDLTILLRILNVLVDIGKTESHHTHYQPSERVGNDAQKDLEQLFQVMSACQRDYAAS